MAVLTIRVLRAGVALTAAMLTCGPVLADNCDWSWTWFATSCRQAKRAFNEGSYDLYLTGYTYHNRQTYTREKIDTYQENSWGGGLGRSVIDERGNWHGLYAMAFQDSHFKPQYMGGYGWLARWNPGGDFHVGVGVTGFVVARSDYDYVPIPGILPLGSLEYKRVSLMASYVPRLSRNEGNGDVLFLFAKVALQ